MNISPPYHTNAHYNPTYHSQGGSQLSIIPKRKKVKTIPFNASPHQIDWSKDLPLKKIEENVDNLLSISPNLNLQMNRSKESLVSFKNSNNKSQVSVKSLRSEENGMKIKSEFAKGIHNCTDANPIAEHLPNPADFNADSLFGSNAVPSQNMFMRDKTSGRMKASNFNFKPSFSGLSYNSFDPSESKLKEPASISQNPVLHLKNSLAIPGGENLIRINAKDLHQFEIDHDQLDVGSQNGSLAELFDNEQTPLLFRGNSGIIDPHSMKRK